MSWRIKRRFSRVFLLAAILATLASPSAPIRAQQNYSIAAVVNEDVISVHDVQARVRMFMAVSGVEGTEENRRRLVPQAMRTLIDERLQLQEAARLNITVSDQELREALATVEQQNKLPPGGLEQRLQAEGVPMSSLQAQLRATLAWSKVIRRQVRPQVEISDEEVDEFLDQLRARGGVAEYEVAEIFIPTDSAADTGTALQTARGVAQQARNGVAFATLAQQYSQSPSANSGGQIGRVQEGQLDRRLDNALRTMNPGDVSDPIRVETGYYVLQLRDKRQRTVAAAPRPSADTVVSLRRIFLPVARGAPARDMRAQAELAATVSETVQGCPDMERLAREVKASGAVDVGRLRTADLPERLRQTVEALPVGKASRPVQIEDGFVVLMVCERAQGSSPAPAPVAAASANLPEREEVLRNLGTQRVEMLARRYLRDLRRAAFVDIRT